MHIIKYQSLKWLTLLKFNIFQVPLDKEKNAWQEKKNQIKDNGKRGKAKIKWEAVVKKTTLYYFNYCPGHERI